MVAVSLLLPPTPAAADPYPHPLFTPSGGTSPSAINDWMAQRCPSPEDFRGPLGTVADTPAMQAAINAAQNAGHGCVWVPAKTYTLGSLFINGNNLTVFCANATGSGGGGTKFLAADPTSTMFTVGIVSGVFLRACSWASPFQQTAGSYVDFEGGNSNGIVDGFMSGGYDPLVMNNTNVMHADHLRFFNWAHNMISIGGGNPGPGAGANGGGGDQYFYDIIGDNDTSVSPNAGFYINQSGGSITISGSDVIHAHNALWIDPGKGQFVSWIYSVNTYLDSCDYPTNLRGGVGLLVTPHGGGIANGGSFANLWASTCSVSAKLVGDASSTLSDYQFSAPRFVHSYGDGVEINYADNIFWSNPTISGGSIQQAGLYNGMVLGANVTQVSILGGHIGPTEQYGATFGYNLYLTPGFSGQLNVESNLSGCASSTGTCVSDGGTAGAPVTIHNTPGFNPRGPVIITPTASPYTYTAGRSPEMVSVIGSGLSTASLSGNSGGPITVCGASPCYTQLAPEQQLTLTYSGAAPYMAANRQ